MGASASTIVNHVHNQAQEIATEKARSNVVITQKISCGGIDGVQLRFAPGVSGCRFECRNFAEASTTPDYEIIDETVRGFRMTSEIRDIARSQNVDADVVLKQVQSEYFKKSRECNVQTTITQLLRVDGLRFNCNADNGVVSFFNFASGRAKCRLNTLQDILGNLEALQLDSPDGSEARDEPNEPNEPLDSPQNRDVDSQNILIGVAIVAGILFVLVVVLISTL